MRTMDRIKAKDISHKAKNRMINILISKIKESKYQR